MDMEVWTHHNPVRIYFGRGCRGSLADMLADQRALVVCSPRGRHQFESDALLGKALLSSKRFVWMDTVETNPDIHRLRDESKHLLDARVDCVIALGGGSAIDSAKVFALALSPFGSQYSLWELLGAAADLPPGASLPLYALPTTAGTGSEVTPYATVWDHAESRKLSLFGPAVYPHTAFVDPELSATVPYSPTLYTGLDAINQAAESIWNRNMTPMSEMVAHGALKLGMTALPRLLNDLANPDLRGIMAEVGLLAGLAISQTRTSLSHSISYPLTAHFGVPHGLACAFTMPAVLRHNLSADDGRFKRLAKVLSHNEDRELLNLIDAFDKFNQRLSVKVRVQEMVKSLDLLLALSEQMITPGRADNNLSPVNNAVIEKILMSSWNSD